MKILFVSPVGSFFSGAEIAIANVMKYLSQQGHEIFNIIPNNESNRDLVYLDFMDQAGIKTYQLDSLKWWWDEAPGFEFDNKNAVAAYHHQNIAEIRDIICQENIELVISNTANVFQGAIAAACQEIPHYYIIHEFPFGEFAYYKEKIKLIDHLSEKIFVVTGELHKELSQYFSAEKLFPFIPYSDIIERELIDSPKNRIVSVGGITPRKNQLELLQAYDRLGKKDLELVFIGGWDEDYKRVCDDFIQQKGLEKVHFLGYKNNPWDIVTNHDIVAFSSSMETFGLVYIESLLNGIPTLVSDNPGHLSVYEKFQAGHLYTLGDVEELTKKLQQLLENFEVEKTQALLDRERVRQEYSLEKTAQIFLDELNLNSSYHEKTLSALSSLFGWRLSKDLLTRIKGEEVRIFFAREGEDFQIENSKAYPLKGEDKIDLVISDFQKVRIDLSENSGTYDNIHLVSQKTGQELLPGYSNALMEKGKSIFLGADPQLIYDVSVYQGDYLNLRYHRYSDIEHRSNVQEMLLSLSQQLEERKAECEALQLAYNTVVTSRRWTIPTKIINFFRRNK